MNSDPHPDPSDPVPTPFGALPDPPADPSAGPQPSAAPGWRQRMLGLRAVAAVAVATLILGGAGGVLLGRAGNGADGTGGFGGPGGGGPGGRFQPGQQGGFPGQQPQGLPPAAGTPSSTGPTPETQPDAEGATTTSST